MENQPGTEQPGAKREDEERIEQRRRADEEMDRREEEGWTEPESSAQKMPHEGGTP
jgi:hypothetical protein